MFKILGLLSAVLVSSAMPQTARADLADDISLLQQSFMIQAAAFDGLNWHVGDKASYKMDIGGFIKGTSNNFVREDTGTAFWMQQDVDIVIQKSKVEILLNKATGQIEKLIIDGKEQSPPKSDQEILEFKEAKITVPAGTYECIYAKIKDKADGKISEFWMNPKIVPMMGMLKAETESQFGKVTQEATSFSFAR